MFLIELNLSFDLHVISLILLTLNQGQGLTFKGGSMQFSAAGLAVLKQAEGLRAQTYLDAAGYPTIGYGHRLVHPECYPHGITEEQASVILEWDVREAEQAVERLVRVPLTQGQFDALVDFTFNLGSGQLASSTLLHDLNTGLYEAAAEQLLRWDHAGNEVVAGLKARREAEFNLWQTKTEPQQAAA
ncbi:MAG: lysozyme [Terracidiphilus sp.]